MQDYTIITVLNNETIYEQSGLHPFKDFDDVVELQRERLKEDASIHRIVVRGRGFEKVITRHDESKTGVNLENVHPVFAGILTSWLKPLR